MKIQFLSDLHLEFPENEAWIKDNPIVPVADTLIMAGDIMLLKDQRKHDAFLKYVARNWKNTFWIPGNHEYYKGIAHQKPFYYNIRPNLGLLNNRSIILSPSVKLIFSTLWSHIRPQNEAIIRLQLNDFKQISSWDKKDVPENMTVNTYNIMYKESVAFLKNELKAPYEKKVVITHYVPTLMNYPSQFKTSPINDAFVSDQTDLILKTLPDYWIYGHHHVNVPAFRFGDTIFDTNQLGYVEDGEHQTFNPSKYFEI